MDEVEGSSNFRKAPKPHSGGERERQKGDSGPEPRKSLETASKKPDCTKDTKPRKERSRTNVSKTRPKSLRSRNAKLRHSSDSESDDSDSSDDSEDSFSDSSDSDTQDNAKTKSRRSKASKTRGRDGPGMSEHDLEKRLTSLEEFISSFERQMAVQDPSWINGADQGFQKGLYSNNQVAAPANQPPPSRPTPLLPQPGRPPSLGKPSFGAPKNRATKECGDNESESEGGGKPTRPDFKRVDWVWDSSLYSFKLQDSAKTRPESRYDGYVFHVRRTFDCDGKYRKTVLDIKSKLLRECLQDVIKNAHGVSLADETPKLDPNLLYLYAEDLRSHLNALKHHEPAGETRKERKKNEKRLDDKRKHLKVLVKYLVKDYAKIMDSLDPMLQSGLITYDLLWALWRPGTLVYTPTYGSQETPRVFKVEAAERHSSMIRGDYYSITGKYFEFDGKRFGYGSISEDIPKFRGAKRITSLPCYPLNFCKDEAKIREELIERGKKFVSLSGMYFKAYSGLAYMKRKKGVLRFNISDSRIMVDPAMFRRINPNYYVSNVRPKKRDLLSTEDDNSDDESGGGCGGESSDEEGDDEAGKTNYVTKLFKDNNGAVHSVSLPKDQLADDDTKERLDELPEKHNAEKGDSGKLDLENNEAQNDTTTPGTDCTDSGAAKQGNKDESNAKEQCDAEMPGSKSPSEGEETIKPSLPCLTDEEYLIASPVVLGFSFAEKQWLEFEVSSVRDIKWNEDAWDSLVLEPGTKDLIKALVEARKYNAATTVDDVIQGKGKGLVTVLHGPPGTGKTLTAEGISELLKCPLYMASAGELGTDSRFLEHELQKILDICHAWGAILLLDEADVFLEKRNMQDIHRNALVSIFLRQLEYFQGILFLTTNRVETFDEAFQSRIHVALRYDRLDSKAKKAIFKLFLERVRAHGKLKLKPFEDNDLNALAKHDLNGREIKNVMGSAQDLAINKGEAMGMRHIKLVLDVHAKFGRDLQGGTGFEDAMRSYF